MQSNDATFTDWGSLRILVAEDVPMDQFLVKHILESRGCLVTVVSNGEEALEQLNAENFDLILMDIQMPGIDGLAATKRIRKSVYAERSTAEKSLVTKNIRQRNTRDKSAIPIIALTATNDDNQTFIRSGMNAYIAKPYTEERLFDMIDYVIRTDAKLNKRLHTNSNNKRSSNATPAQLFDLSMINAMGPGDGDFAKGLIEIFLESMPESIGELRTEAGIRNILQVRKAAHKMKSSIDLFGISSLRGPIRRLENATDDDDVITQINDLDATLQKIYVELKKLL